MLTYSELQKGVKIILAGQPYEILEAKSLFKGRGHSVLQARTKNLISGNVVSKTFHPSDTFEQAEISKFKAEFLYSNQGKFFFSEKGTPKKRFDLTKEQIGEIFQFLKPGQEVEVLKFKEKVINISLPIKIQLKVIEAPPGVQGSRSQPGTKQITLETGAKINAPLFIKEGDIIEINTETAKYVRRVD